MLDVKFVRHTFAITDNFVYSQHNMLLLESKLNNK